MKSLIILSIALTTCLSVGAGTKHYSWWFDDLTETTAHHGKVGSSLDLDVDASPLSPGIHTLHILVREEDGAVSNVVSQPFIKTEENKGVIVHYCVDGQLTATGKPKPDEFHRGLISNQSNLQPGIHTAHILVSDHNGAFLSAVSQPFVVPSDAYGKTLYLCVDGELRETHALPDGSGEHRTDIDLTDLALGTHSAQAFLQDSDGKMSEIKEGNFERVPTKAELGEQVGVLLLEEETGQCRVYDLQGRPLKNASEVKIVIRNGRKEAGKH